MKQEQRNKPQKQKGKSSELKQSFEAEKEKTIEHITRTVTLKYASGCGCGGYTNVKREVPFDSPLQDGDRITRLLDTDKVV